MRAETVLVIILMLLLCAAPVLAGTGKPVVDFSANVTSGLTPLAVMFTDNSLAADGWAWFFGDETYRAPWTGVNGSAGWSKRSLQCAVLIPDGSIVLMGGFDINNNFKNDTWLSADKGGTWLLVNGSSGWSARQGHSCVAEPDGSIVLMGGLSDNYLPDDVWRSADKGTTWTLVNASPGWTGRRSHSSVALPDGGIVLTGGSTGGTFQNDTWLSTDAGATWVLMNASSGWPKRWSHSSVAMPDGSIVLTGGILQGALTRNDTWRSADKGATWTLLNASSGWTTRGSHSSVAMPDGSIVLTGGADGSKILNDTWRSADGGARWTLLNASSGWPERQSHSSVAMPDGSIVLMSGSYLNETWRFQPAGSSVQNPSHTYTKPGILAVSLQAYNIAGSNSTRKAGYIHAVTPDKIGVFRNSTHTFYEDYNGNGAWNGAATDRSFNFGIAGDIPVTGDWNNDSLSEIGVFRPSTHLFYLDGNANGVWNGALTDKTYNFGITGDIPVTGDWNHDGISEIGVFRPSTHLFYLDHNGNGVWNGAAIDRSYNFGMTGDIPLTGDWTNNGITEIGVFRPSTHRFYLDTSGNGVWNGAVTDRSFNFGITGDIPVTGDWTGNGITEIGVFRPSTHLFYLDWNGNGVWNGALTDKSYSFGISGDTPVAGAWG